MAKPNKYSGNGTRIPEVHFKYTFIENGVVFSNEDGSHPFTVKACCLKHSKEVIAGFVEAFDYLADDQKAEFDNCPLVFANYFDTHSDMCEFYSFPESVLNYWRWRWLANPPEPLV